MRRIVALLMLLGSALTFGNAVADPITPNVPRIAKLAMASIVYPPEWEGIWTTVDSFYYCNSTFISASSASDTVCSGTDYESPNFTCSGTIDATTLDFTCTGTDSPFPGCVANFTVVNHGTRSGDSYFIVSMAHIEYPGPGCLGYPTQCLQQNSHGTRIGPAPAEFCATTPTKRSTWGRIKAIYR